MTDFDLFRLAREGHTDELAAHLDAGISVDLANDRGDSLLMLASYHGHRETTDALLTRGADANVANDRGQTPLAGAVFKGNIDIVEALLKHGADPGAGSPSAIATAAMFGREDLLNLLS
jgi:ankyrin repeat protein